MAKRRRNADTGLKIAEYEVEDIGVENSQNFQGVSTTFSDWDTVEYGIGEDFNEALGDALEMLAQSEDIAAGELDRIEKKEKVSQKKSDKHSVSAYLKQYGEEDGEEDGEAGDLYYHVAVYVKWRE